MRLYPTDRPRIHEQSPTSIRRTPGCCQLSGWPEVSPELIFEEPSRDDLRLNLVRSLEDRENPGIDEEP